MCALEGRHDEGVRPVSLVGVKAISPSLSAEGVNTRIHGEWPSHDSHYYFLASVLAVQESQSLLTWWRRRSLLDVQCLFL